MYPVYYSQLIMLIKYGAVWKVSTNSRIKSKKAKQINIRYGTVVLMNRRKLQELKETTTEVEDLTCNARN